MTETPKDLSEDVEAAIAGEPESEADRKTRLIKTGIGIGVGSAALVAALLYANANRKKKPSAPTIPPEPQERD